MRMKRTNRKMQFYGIFQIKMYRKQSLKIVAKYDIFHEYSTNIVKYQRRNALLNS